MALRLDEVLAGGFRPRTKTVNYGNGLEFELQAFPADAFQEAVETIADTENCTEHDWVALSIRAIMGADCQPTNEQVESFKAKLDKGVIEQLALDWLRFNRGAEDLAEAAKKS